MTQQKSQSSKESSWRLVRFFYFIYTNAYSVYVWLFPERYMVYENNESGLLMRRYMEDKSFFDQLSSGWVELHLGSKILIMGGVSLASGLIGIVFGAPMLCMLFALSSVIGVHTILVAHEHHRRHLAKSMIEKVQVVQKDLEAQQEVFEQAHEHFYDVASELEGHLDSMSDGVQAIQEDVSDIKKKKEGYVATITQVGLLAGEMLEKQGELTVQIDEHIDDMRKVSQALDKEVESINQFSHSVSTFETTVDGFADTQKKYADAVSEFGIFVSKQRETNKIDEVDVYDEKLKNLIDMLDDANAQMDELNCNSGATVAI